jgi:hypothetical protein
VTHARMQAIGLGLLTGIVFLSAAAASAGENGRPAKCALDTLKGQYLVASNGTVFPPAFGVTIPSVSAVAGYSIFYGDGTGEDYVTLTINGANQNAASPISTTYTLNHDCTGTKKVMNGPTFNIYVAFDGSALSEVSVGGNFSVAAKLERMELPEEQ